MKRGGGDKRKGGRRMRGRKERAERHGGGADGKWGDEREEVKVSEENSDDSMAMKDKRCSLCGLPRWSLY